MNYIKLLIILLATSCSEQYDKDKNWKANKSKMELNPTDSIEFKEPKEFANLTGQELIWTNQSLINYPYKKNCPNKILITIDLKDSLIQNTIKEDSLSICYYLLERFKEDGVSHFAFQMIHNNMLKICLYIENGMNPIGILKTIEIPLNADMETEEDWKTYTYYLEKR